MNGRQEQAQRADLCDEPSDALTIHVPIKLRRRGGRKVIVHPDGQQRDLAGSQADASLWPRNSNPALVRSLVQAFRWQAMLDEGPCSTITDIAAAEKLDPSFVSRTIRLTLLSPDIVETILVGDEPDEVQRQRLLHQPHIIWAEQGFAK